MIYHPIIPKWKEIIKWRLYTGYIPGSPQVCAHSLASSKWPLLPFFPRALRRVSSNSSEWGHRVTGPGEERESSEKCSKKYISEGNYILKTDWMDGTGVKSPTRRWKAELTCGWIITILQVHTNKMLSLAKIADSWGTEPILPHQYLQCNLLHGPAPLLSNFPSNAIRRSWMQLQSRIIFKNWFFPGV